MQYSLWILATRHHELMHKLMHNMSCHQHTSPPLSSTKRRSTTIKCLWYKFNSLHEKHNIYCYHHASLLSSNGKISTCKITIQVLDILTWYDIHSTYSYECCFWYLIIIWHSWHLFIFFKYGTHSINLYISPPLSSTTRRTI